ncbi:MvaI/BcnI family restriction endonuclease [Larkinella soli]|uniref:MvaI/BcnI family restriction endonuclease n=1 Tax=Larkinella soli TaxID=1770527 RepID=UPI000FFC5FE4|nr:MvaI/BcnI family restriction endonuclease [Larkinella soli]
MNLNNLQRVFAANGCQKIYVKTLAENDNSKNQVYLGGSFEILNVFPASDIQSESPGGWKRERFKASVRFAWITEIGSLAIAPNAQLILYPKYPEVRFSGFLLGCPEAPSGLMKASARIAGRLLFLGVAENSQILGYVTAPDSGLATEFNGLTTDNYGVFRVLRLAKDDNRGRLLSELKRIHELDWIPSKRLDRAGGTMACEAPNCGGYTLEAELGITPNGYSEPDFLGWEVKQFGVRNFERIGSEVITLMTPEPTGGAYVVQGLDYFMRRYGYADRMGRADRINFGGIHIAGARHPTTQLRMELIGFDTATGKIRSADGRIALVDPDGNEAATWSFASMLKHWNRKHNQACYVPSQSETDPVRQYRYGSLIILGVGTDFQLFLQQMASGNIYYDPGIKMENASSAKPTTKRRSQFRTKSLYLRNLYRINEIADLDKI